MQKVGMGLAFVNGYSSGMEVMREIEEAISFKISRLINEGPIEELSKTENAQLAIFAISAICTRILEREYGYIIEKKCKYLAGHSLGEYAALCSAGVFSITDGAKIVKRRSELMANVSGDAEESCMVALLGVCASDVEDTVAAYNVGRDMCVIANDNSPSEVVISGIKRTVKEVVEKVKISFNLLKAIELNTSGPFHSPLMCKAAIEYDKYLLQNFNCNDFKVPVIMNTTARPLTEKKLVHEHLIRQITDRVRWRETVELIVDDPEITKIVEVAPGRTLSKMIKRSYPDVDVISLETVSQVEEFVQSE